MIFSLSFKRIVIAIVYNNVKKVEIMSFLGRFIPQNRDISYHIPDFFANFAPERMKKKYWYI